MRPTHATLPHDKGMRAIEPLARDACWVVIYAANARDLCARHVLSPEKSAYTVGRHPECDIVLASVATSRQHSRLERRGDAWWLFDLGSLNGTYVNDARIVQCALAHGDRVQVGDTIVKHLADDVETAFAEAIHATMVTDGLTQAATKSEFATSLESAVRRGRERGTPVGVVVLDLDHFKNVNDAYGHPAGDRVLREFVQVVRRALPDGVKVGRLGGEEFGLLAVGLSPDVLVAVCEQVRIAVSAHPFAVPAGTVNLTTSLGLAMLGTSDADGETLYQRADRQLYEAKRRGRNCLST